MRSWSLVVPMWQEASRIAATADSELAQPDIELILVDDGSTDGTVRLCEQALVRHRLDASVRRLPTNNGKGAAVRHGILSASGQVVGFSDADLSCDPDDIVSVMSVVSDARQTWRWPPAPAPTRRCPSATPCLAGCRARRSTCSCGCWA